VPGIGKTTVVRAVARGLRGRTLAGFYTEELRAGRERRGFRAVAFDGWMRDIARADIAGPARVGKYGVDVPAIDALVEHALAEPGAVDIHLVDEIGKMECLSERFVAAMRALLDGATPLVATVALRGGGLIAEVKTRPDVEVWHVTLANREQLPSDVLGWLARGSGARGVTGP
jgi:nucleoside-triphosphatase